MSREGLTDTLDAADPDNVAQRPASNLLLAGTGLSLALAVSAVVGLPNNDYPGPTVAGEISAAQGPIAPLAIDRTGVGQITVDEMAAATLAPSNFAASFAGGPTPVPASRRNAATAPQPSFAPANSSSQMGADVSGPDLSTAQANASDASTGAFGEGRAEPQEGAPGVGAPGASAPSPTHAAPADGAAPGNAGDESNGDSHAGKTAGSGGDESGDSDDHGDHGSQGGHGGQRGR